MRLGPVAVRVLTYFAVKNTNSLDENRDDTQRQHTTVKPYDTPFTFFFGLATIVRPCGAHDSTVEPATTVAYTSGGSASGSCAGAALSSCISTVESATTVAYTSGGSASG